MLYRWATRPWFGQSWTRRCHIAECFSLRKIVLSIVQVAGRAAHFFRLPSVRPYQVTAVGPLAALLYSCQTCAFVWKCMGWSSYGMLCMYEANCDCTHSLNCSLRCWPPGHLFQRSFSLSNVCFEQEQTLPTQGYVCFDMLGLLLDTRWQVAWSINVDVIIAVAKWADPYEMHVLPRCKR